jgi:hypothetical protein
MSSRAENPTGSQELADSESGTVDSEETEQEQPGSEKPESTGIEEANEVESLSLDTIFEILKNQRRRYVLQYLRDADGTVQLNELADQVAAWENDKPVNLVSSNERKRVYVGLYQCHLTKMNDSNVIDFDQYRGSVEVRPEIDQLYEYLDFGEETDEEPTPGPSRFYPAVSGGALAVGLIGLALPTVTIGLHGFLLVAVLAVTVFGVSVAERYSDEELEIDALPTVPNENQ